MWDLDKLRIIKGDITNQNVDVIVNAANVSLMGGGGVDGAIHKAAGPELLQECKKFHGCPTGDARVTKGYNLSAKYIIHTPGPIWRGGYFDEETLLRKSYISSLMKAIDLKAKTIAFPSISTGGHKFPLDIASKIAVSAIYEVLSREENEVEEVYIICTNDDTYKQYQKVKENCMNMNR